MDMFASELPGEMNQSAITVIDFGQPRNIEVEIR